MRKMPWLLLLLAGCSGPDADPIDVAERFHALRLAGDDVGLHALLTDADRAAIPFEAFPAALPAGVALDLLGWGDARLDSASLLSAGADTAAVLLHVSGGAVDTVRLMATHDPLRLWRFELDRVRWRVSMGLEERALLDSLAAPLRANPDALDSAAVHSARAYLQAAERHPGIPSAADVEAARATLRRASLAEALRIDIEAAESLTGRFIRGRIENPTARRVATLRLVVRDAAGGEQRVDVWGIEPGAATEVGQLTGLRVGPLTYRVERIQVY